MNHVRSGQILERAGKATAHQQRRCKRWTWQFSALSLNLVLKMLHSGPRRRCSRMLTIQILFPILDCRDDYGPGYCSFVKGSGQCPRGENKFHCTSSCGYCPPPCKLINSSHILSAKRYFDKYAILKTLCHQTTFFVPNFARRSLLTF